MRSGDDLFAEADRLEELGDQQGALRVWRELEEAESALRHAIALDPQSDAVLLQGRDLRPWSARPGPRSNPYFQDHEL